MSYIWRVIKEKDASSKLSQLYIYVLEGLTTAAHEYAEVWFALARVHWFALILARTGIFRINTACLQAHILLGIEMTLASDVRATINACLRSDWL